MSNATTTASNGIGFPGLLAILFIALKLTHYIDWRWRWVLAPIWIAAGFWIVVIAVLLAIWLIALVVER